MRRIINKPQFVILKRFNNAIIQFVTFHINLSNIVVILFINLSIIDITQSKLSNKNNIIIKSSVNI